MGSFVADRYELLRRVGQGPIAELHHGRLRASAGFARPVAVRTLEPRFAKDPRFVGTWAAAATEIAQRPSVHLEEVIDLVVDGERVYVVTEWIEGLSLARFVAAHGRPPWEPITRALVGVLDGLHRMHCAQPALAHCGVRADAVRLSVDGSVKITRAGVAAGLAAIGQGRAEAEEAGLRHAAPELRDGQSASPASDQFGVGVMAFEALAGRPPFADDALRGEPADLTELRDDVPPLLVALIERAIRPDPYDRFASADELARALERLLHAEPIPVDAAALGRAVRELRAPEAGTPRAAPMGPAALAATIRAMRSSDDGLAPDKRPVGLPADNATQMVADEELKELSLDKYEAQLVESERPPAGLSGEESVALPLMLTKTKPEKRPQGLGRARTEFLDESQVDRLTLHDDPAQKARPKGLTPANTEFLDESAVDRLTIEPSQKSKRPQGLGAARTEFLDGSQVDRLTLPDGPARPRGLSPANTEFLDEDEVDRLRVDEGDDESE